MATTMTAGHTAVPGGERYHEVRGSGPLVLVIGSPMTAEAFGPLADLLAPDHTVVTHDPHGLGRSTVADPSPPVTRQAGVGPAVFSGDHAGSLADHDGFAAVA